MCETLCDRDYKRHCLMAVDAVVPCDVSMLIWCLGVCRIHRIDGKQLMAMEAISVRCRHYFLIKHHHHQRYYHHYYNWPLMMDWRRRRRHLNCDYNRIQREKLETKVTVCMCKWVSVNVFYVCVCFLLLDFVCVFILFFSVSFCLFVCLFLVSDLFSILQIFQRKKCLICYLWFD